MAQFAIKVDLSDVMAQARGIIDAAVLPLLHQAVGAVAQQARIDWMKAVQYAKLWSGEKVLYGESIQWKMTGAFSAEVWSDYKYADEIETGRPARDLKVMLQTSAKVRTTKTGKRYLIIPFSHNTPGNDAHAQSMPKDVYAAASQLTKTTIVGRGRRLSGLNASSLKTRKLITVSSRKYNWGDSLSADAVPGMHKNHANMYRFDTSSGKSRGSRFLTFRVMMEGSAGWMTKPVPGTYMVKGVVDILQPFAEKVFAEAVNRDLS